MRFFIFIGLALTLLHYQHVSAQTFGPNSPSTGANTTSIGTLAWTSPTNVLSSNNAYASVVAKGVTNYVMATNFGFTVPATTAINGIQLDVEKSTLSPTIVTVLNNWTSGFTKTISAGSNRMLLFIYSSENGNGSRDLTALTYGGQTMTQIVEGVTGAPAGFEARLEFWVLLESGIASATSTAFSATFATVTLNQNVEFYSSAVYSGVDQVLPYTSTQIFTTTTTNSTITVSPTLATTGGGMAVAAIHCGNNTTPASSIGGTNTYSVSSSFTETIDTYTGCACTNSTTGISTEIAHQTIASSGTIAPSYTFAGTPNRQIVIYVNLTCVREIDNSVRLLKSGVLTGSDFAYTSAPWNTADTYTSYGGAANLWGTTWTVADINSTTFGAVLSASVNNGTAQVDHMRITVTGSSTLPVELIDFYGEVRDGNHYLAWQTASEHQNKEFVIETCDGINEFRKIGTVSAKPYTGLLQSYSFINAEPCRGLNYYRLRQVDVGGISKYYKTIVINNDPSSSGDLVYPNPTYDGRLTLVSKQVITDGVYIYSSDLKLIKSVLDGSSNTLNLSLTELTDGTYYLIYNFKGEQRMKQVQKICR